MKQAERETVIVAALERFGAEGATIHAIGAEIGLDHSTLYSDLERLERARVAKRRVNPNWKKNRRPASGTRFVWRLT